MEIGGFVAALCCLMLVVSGLVLVVSMMIIAGESEQRMGYKYANESRKIS